MKKYFFYLSMLMLVSGCASTQNSQKLSSSDSSTAVFSSAELTDYRAALEAAAAGELKDAATSLQKISKSHPDVFAVWINLASIYWLDKNITAAENALRNARIIKPKAPEVYNLLGLMDVEKADYLAAEKNYKMAISLNEKNPDFQYNLALLYDIYIQDITKAVEYYDHYLALVAKADPDTASWVEELRRSLKSKT